MAEPSTKSDRTLLIVEDDPGLQSQMRWCFDRAQVLVADSRRDAEDVLAKHKPSVVTLDLGLPPDAGGTSEGFALLASISEHSPRTKVIVITGREERDTALQAIASGAYDFYQKPIDSQTLRFVVERAFRLSELEEQIRKLGEESAGVTPLPGLLATSQSMLTLCEQLKRVAPTETSVLITGETGTGKEILARNIHDLSKRDGGALVTINCAAIPENLLESELFGHEKGSFTGAHARKIGKVEAANGGTLFLDEIGDMPTPLQAKILRFLQERSFERVGATQSLSADVRVIAATHRNLAQMIEAGDFREDLYFRLSEICLELPPLRDRGSDVFLIAQHLLSQNETGRSLKFTEDAVEAIEAYPWPGNIRELENRVRRAAILTDSNAVSAEVLQLAESSGETVKKLKVVRAEAESLAITRALAAAGGNVSEASRLLGVSRPTLYNLIEKYSIITSSSEDD